MKIYLFLDGDRVTGYGDRPSYIPNEIEVEVDEGHELLRNPVIFKYVDDKLIKDGEYQQQLIKEREEEKNKPSDEELNAIALMELTELMMGGK
ncbi:hypothetical protein [Sediminibacillus terrae]|uniref:hypothetical protein n=1 Tax=Sediminibacillus terrae TaxID=1562106 RepID=UPI001294EC41|nr:hypothetical protein [Sediminibacillus terrae]